MFRGEVAESHRAKSEKRACILCPTPEKPRPSLGRSDGGSQGYLPSLLCVCRVRWPWAHLCWFSWFGSRKQDYKTKQQPVLPMVEKMVKSVLNGYEASDTLCIQKVPLHSLPHSVAT